MSWSRNKCRHKTEVRNWLLLPDGYPIDVGSARNHGLNAGLAGICQTDLSRFYSTPIGDSPQPRRKGRPIWLPKKKAPLPPAPEPPTDPQKTLF